MGLSRADFSEFFASTHDGQPPFDWQERLLDAVLDTGRWPARVVAPTGAGKTAVIDVHVFAQALTADAEPDARPPRRLSLVVGRRVLVDDQHEYARDLARRLATPGPQVMGQVAERLWSLRRSAGEGQAAAGSDTGPGDGPGDGTAGVSPLVVGRLRGGEQPSRAWRDHPAAAAVLCATPDMWGSRLLFRGYAASPKAWPREAGLLAFDSVLVVDEAHLAEQFLRTARRVSDLTRVARTPIGVPPLQVVETTATPVGVAPCDGNGADAAHGQADGDGRTEIGVQEPDLSNATLQQRLTRPKPLRLLPVKDWSSPREACRRKVAAVLADAVQELLATGRGPDGGPTDPVATVSPTVGCFVNTVTRALDVAAELRSRTDDGRPLRVVTICGRVRPHDLDQLRAQHPGVLSSKGSPDIDVIVSTQSLEVGVDLDLAAMVTELAAGSALAQRAGRVNRRGLRRAGPIIVVVPEDPVTDKTRSGPYQPEELAACQGWLHRCAESTAGLSPWRLRELPPPTAQCRRPLYQRPELADAWQWARTSDDLAADPELGLWLSEDFTADTSVSIAVRQALPVEPERACQLLRDLPPRRHELFGVPYRTAVAALGQWHLQRQEAERDRPGERPEAIVVRGEEVAVLAWRDPTEDPRTLEAREASASGRGPLPVIRPGDIVVLDDQEALFTASSAGTNGGFSPPVVAPADDDGITIARSRAHDVLSAQAELSDLWPSREVGGVALRLEPAVLGAHAPAFAELASDLTALHAPDDTEGQTDQTGDVAAAERDVLRDWLTRTGIHGRWPMAAAALRLLQTDPRSCELIVHRGPGATDEPSGDHDDETDPPIARVIILDRRKRLVDEALRQVWTPARSLVTLPRHQQAVGRRAALIGARVGLGGALIAVLRSAGEHHDDGKADERFQRRLGRRGDVVLAKSRPGTTTEQLRRNDQRSGLPAWWRHEQRSVLDSWAAVRVEHDQAPHQELVSRLIGTSHGHGRHGFPHTAGELLDNVPDEARALAVDVFDHGGWDELVDRTHQQYGVWACAYLEALLRAADSQVSQEGS